MSELYVLGICGTFMGGVARLAAALGHRVAGCDDGVYPPMSTQLAAAGIRVDAGYEPARLDPPPDCVLVGNALSRGNPAVEHCLDHDLAITSGPQWLAEQVLRGRHVVAVAGTHGKTTTASMLAWILEAAGLEPGFLIGGVPGNFGLSARLGAPAAPFVVEADEYDTAFFDKRSKFVHYRPRTLVITGIEHDHADIFPDVAAIRRQFHHLVRTLPASGRILRARPDAEIDALLAEGCWTPVEGFGEADGQWRLGAVSRDAGRFEIHRDGRPVGRVEWPLFGRHNARDALAAVAAAAVLGVEPAAACAALGRFEPARRRLELRGEQAGVRIYDDFAHHPTAVRETLAALRAHLGAQARILAVLDPASATMRLGVHRARLGEALAGADLAWVHRGARLRWDPAELPGVRVGEAPEALARAVAAEARPGDHVVVLSNAAFGGFHERLLAALAGRTAVRADPEARR